ncbi:MAG TPA: hypothetical protein VFS09_13495 [Candidatus Eisenbacteria bacterium]|nr:hypothetical protein [Candidatus Eisenbacteria bacterium]
MGRRGNQTFLKNQKAQKRVARANAKRAEKQARRDDKIARAANGDVTSGPPIEWGEGVDGAAAETPESNEGNDEEGDDEETDSAEERVTAERA